MPLTQLHCGDCGKLLRRQPAGMFHLSFVDPPFNQGKDYRFFDDNQTDAQYWAWMQEILGLIRQATTPGGAIYFMQREKNAEQVLHALRLAGWNFQNMIIWKRAFIFNQNERRFCHKCR